MSYEVLILRRAQKELAGITGSNYERVRDEIASLAEHPRPTGCKKLVGGKAGASEWGIIASFMRSMMLSNRYWSCTSVTGATFTSE
jgi:hypothetical protein